MIMDFFKMMKIAIIGASKDRHKFSNAAVRAYKNKDHVVFPINPNYSEIEGLKCYSSLREVPLDIDIVSLYVPPEVGIKITEDILSSGVKKVILNPGTESKDIIQKLKLNGVKVLLTCSIRKIGENPRKYLTS